LNIILEELNMHSLANYNCAGLHQQIDLSSLGSFDL